MLLLFFLGPVIAASGSVVAVGTARIDITPELPIRLSGYGNRATEADRVEQRLHARALAIGSDAGKPVVLITVDLIGVTEQISDGVAAALLTSHGLERARVAVSATHTHTGPVVAGTLPYMFARDLPADEVARIDAYAALLRKKLVEVATAALADRKPARLAWAEGQAGFTGHRRVVVDGKWTAFGRDPNGPADRALPVLRVADERGNLRAVFTSYACHCTTLTGTDNYLHGDWAGEAAAVIEAEQPGAVALVAIGCGADANPQPRGASEHVATHGREIAGEVARLLSGPMRPLGPVTATGYRRIYLDLDRAVTREELEERLKTQRAPGKHAASKFIQRLDSGRPLPTKVPYPIQTWGFGNDLVMVFLAGEVVSEYSLRLKRELDGARVWVNAYANSLPCYIPSKRMYPEGGYEVDGSMDYYGWPTRLAIETEDRIIETVHALVPPEFKRPGPGRRAQ
jgi:neutral ceramidase